MADTTARVLNDPVAATGLPSILKYNSLSKMVQHKRKIKLDCPSLPKDWDNMIIPENMRTIHDNLPIVIMEKGIADDSNKVIWGFSSPSGLDTMRGAEFIFGDGTFEMVKQTLFSLHEGPHMSQGGDWHPGPQAAPLGLRDCCGEGNQGRLSRSLVAPSTLEGTSRSIFRPRGLYRST